jgi:hypothetical protein
VRVAGRFLRKRRGEVDCSKIGPNQEGRLAGLAALKLGRRALEHRYQTECLPGENVDGLHGFGILN